VCSYVVAGELSSEGYKEESFALYRNIVGWCVGFAAAVVCGVYCVEGRLCACRVVLVYAVGWYLVIGNVSTCGHSHARFRCIAA
jgi:hypothetical protein